MKLFIEALRLDGGSRGKYEHIEFRIYRPSDLEASSAKPVLTFSWQGDRDSTYWYAFRAKTEAETLTGYDRFKISATLLAKLEPFGKDEPIVIWNTLNLERRVYDDRCSAWLKVEEVLPAAWRRYMAWGNDHCLVACMAPDEESAGKLLMKEFAQHFDSGFGDYAQKLESWIKDGKPIRIDAYRAAPDVRDIETLLKPMKEEFKGEVAA